MNKYTYRVIFSKVKQCLVVVSELAKSAVRTGTSKTVDTPSETRSSSLTAKIKPLTFSLFCAFGFVSLSTPTLAETLIIKADPTAPTNQQPNVISTDKSIQQVNIQTPNEKGLSHNKYSQFDVPEKGVILNNSRTSTQTQLSGNVAANPNLANGEAKVILNEVNSNKASVMKGYVEVAGQKADVIIANPSGIHCEGCGIINADRATLTTGTAQINNGTVEGFVVEKGKVRVSGKGMDNSGSDYTEILTKEAQINAGVWANKQVTVAAGKNTIKRSNSDKSLQITKTSSTDNTEEATYAVDIKQLGGMYAEKIHLIGTENGLGVRNAGHIGASADSVTIDTQGQILNTGVIDAQKQVTLTAPKGVENRGTITSQAGDIQLTSAANIKQDGTVVAKGNIQYQGQNVTQDQDGITAAGASLNNGTLKLDKTSAQGSNLTVAATTKASLRGQTHASGKMDVKAKAVNLIQNKITAHDASVESTESDLVLTNTTATASGKFQLITPSILFTKNSQLTAGQFETSQKSLDALGSQWNQTGTGDLQLTANSLNTTNATLITNGNLSLKADKIDNSQGTISSAKSLTIETENDVKNIEGNIIGQEGINVTALKINNNLGNIRTGNRLTFNLTNMNNVQGQIQADKGFDINVTQFLNQNGTLESQEGISNLTAYHFYGRGGSTLKTGGTLNIDTFAFEQMTGSILSAKELNATSYHFHTYNNSELYADNFTANLAHLANHRAILQVKDNLDLKIGLLENHHGSISSENGNVTIVTTGHLENQGGTVAAKNGNLSLTVSRDLRNQEGNIEAKTVNITTWTLNNNATSTTGTIVASSGEVGLTITSQANKAE